MPHIPAASSPPDQRQPWRHAAKLATLKRVPGRGPSDHLAGSVERSVWINALAKSYSVIGSERALPPGALIAQRHHAPNSERVVSTFVMHKRPDGSNPDQSDWSYVVLDEADRVVAEGRLPRCHRCHAEARHDHLFGPP
jgi:hypothetical protein